MNTLKTHTINTFSLSQTMNKSKDEVVKSVPRVHIRLQRARSTERLNTTGCPDTDKGVDRSMRGRSSNGRHDRRRVREEDGGSKARRSDDDYGRKERTQSVPPERNEMESRGRKHSSKIERSGHPINSREDDGIRVSYRCSKNEKNRRGSDCCKKVSLRDFESRIVEESDKTGKTSFPKTRKEGDSARRVDQKFHHDQDFDHRQERCAKDNYKCGGDRSRRHSVESSRGRSSTRIERSTSRNCFETSFDAHAEGSPVRAGHSRNTKVESRRHSRRSSVTERTSSSTNSASATSDLRCQGRRSSVTERTNSSNSSSNVASESRCQGRRSSVTKRTSTSTSSANVASESRCQSRRSSVTETTSTPTNSANAATESRCQSRRSSVTERTPTNSFNAKSNAGANSCEENSASSRSQDRCFLVELKELKPPAPLCAESLNHNEIFERSSTFDVHNMRGQRRLSLGSLLSYQSESSGSSSSSRSAVQDSSGSANNAEQIRKISEITKSTDCSDDKFSQSRRGSLKSSWSSLGHFLSSFGEKTMSRRSSEGALCSDDSDTKRRKSETSEVVVIAEKHPFVRRNSVEFPKEEKEESEMPACKPSSDVKKHFSSRGLYSAQEMKEEEETIVAGNNQLNRRGHSQRRSSSHATSNSARGTTKRFSRSGEGTDNVFSQSLPCFDDSQSDEIPEERSSSSDGCQRLRRLSHKERRPSRRQSNDCQLPGTTMRRPSAPVENQKTFRRLSSVDQLQSELKGFQFQSDVDIHRSGSSNNNNGDCQIRGARRPTRRSSKNACAA